MGAPWPGVSAAEAAALARKVGSFSFSDDQRRHWAWQPVRQPPLPAVKGTGWVKTPIDRFILAKLEAKGLSPAPTADRRTLIRRATFDLTGLPPTAAEIEAFAADRAPDAWAKVVDRLLASPRYGERWGRYWLDVARYADTKGYVFQEERRYPFAYTYRDWVVRAFNEDLPYDQFLTQQIAADQLPLGEDRRPLAAMGFLTLGRRFLNNQPDIIDDRLDVVFRGTQALTVGCARCHDHKFDPIPTADYYSLYGVFASSVEPKDPPLIGTPERDAAFELYEKQAKAQEAEVARFLESRREELVAKYRKQTAAYLLAETEVRQQTSVEGLRTFARGRDLNGLLLQRWRNLLDETRKGQHPIFGPWHAFAALPAAEFAAKAPALAAQVAARQEAWQSVNPRVAAAFADAPPASLREVAERYSQLFAEAERAWTELPAKPDSPAALPDADQEALRQVVAGPNAPSNVAPAEFERLLDRDARNQLQALRQKLDKLRLTSPEVRAMALEDSPRPVTPHIFRRGNPGNVGDEVPRQFLLVLAGENRKPFQKGSGRLELAQAIASKQNPLTARVAVNRIWLHHFGAGLVRTPSDFGMRSDPPTHPELLDYLACQFMADNWSVKQLHRRIMLSATYQQDSSGRSPGPQSAGRNPQASDPENRFLSHMNRQRLDLEALRDSLLYVAGGLDETRGGRAVEITTAPYSPRRTIYGFIDRQNLQGLFRTFDFASPDATSPQRYQTTVPQQALFMLNSPFVIEQARRLAARSEVAGAADPAERLRQLYRLAYGRAPAADELALGLRYVKEAEGAAVPVSQPAPEAANRLAPWEQYAQILLMSNEFIFVD
jgi:hypothetical protein